VNEEWQHARQPPRRRVLRQEISFPVDCGCLASAQSACPRTRLCGMQAEGSRYETPPGRTRRPMKRVCFQKRDPRSSYRYPHQVSKVNSLWARRATWIREVARMDPQPRKKDWLMGVGRRIGSANCRSSPIITPARQLAIARGIRLFS